MTSTLKVFLAGLVIILLGYYVFTPSEEEKVLLQTQPVAEGKLKTSWGTTIEKTKALPPKLYRDRLPVESDTYAEPQSEVAKTVDPEPIPEETYPAERSYEDNLAANMEALCNKFPNHEKCGGIPESEDNFALESEPEQEQQDWTDEEELMPLPKPHRYNPSSGPIVPFRPEGVNVYPGGVEVNLPRFKFRIGW